MAVHVFARPAEVLEAVGLRLQVLVTGLSHFNFGYNTASISGALLFIDSERVDCAAESICLTNSFAKGCVVSSCQLGAILGALVAGFMGDQLGRKPTLLANNIFYIMGPLGMFLAPNAYLLVLARLLTGVGVGVASALVHVYISEVVPAEERGKHGVFVIMMGTSGMLFASLMGYVFSYRWRFVLGASALSALLQAALGPFVMPNSVCNQKAWERADGALKSNDGRERVALWPAVLKGGEVREAFVVGIGLQVMQQTSGINNVIYYAPKVLTEASFSNELSILTSAAISGVQILSTLFLSLLVDRVGRKPMCFTGLAIMVFGLLVLGTTFLVPGKAAGWVAPVAMLVYRMAFSISLGPLPAIITAEIFPASCRASGAAVCWATNWAANFVVSQTFPSMLEYMTPAGTFFLYAAICMAAVCFVWTQVPETLGRKLEDAPKNVIEEQTEKSSPKGTIQMTGFSEDTPKFSGNGPKRQRLGWLCQASRVDHSKHDSEEDSEDDSEDDPEDDRLLGA